MKPVPFPSTASSFRRYAAQAQPFMLLLWVAMGAFPAWAQTGASLSGVVTDQTGAALRDVAVTFKNVDTGATRKITTDGGSRGLLRRHRHPGQRQRQPRDYGGPALGFHGLFFFSPTAMSMVGTLPGGNLRDRIVA